MYHFLPTASHYIVIYIVVRPIDASSNNNFVCALKPFTKRHVAQRLGHIRSSERSEEFGRSVSEVGYAPVRRPEGKGCERKIIFQYQWDRHLYIPPSKVLQD